MIKTSLLQKSIQDSGKRKEELCSKMHISLTSLNNKIANRKQFKVNEIEILSNELGLSSPCIFEIFFSSLVSKLDTDKVIEVHNA